MNMNVTISHDAAGHRTNTRSHTAIDWVSQIKLAIVLSVVVALIATVLAGRVADSTIVLGAIVVASFVAWSRVDTPARRTATVHVRHR